jgi:hypothetical protein
MYLGFFKYYFNLKPGFLTIKLFDMGKIFTCGLLFLLLIFGCKYRAEKNMIGSDVKQNGYLEYFVAQVGPQNTRNSEAAIVPLKDGFRRITQ